MTATDSLTARMDALAKALASAGVDAERVAGILGAAATATMNALLLDAVLEEQLLAAPEPETHVPAPVEIVEQPLRVAA